MSDVNAKKQEQDEAPIFTRIGGSKGMWCVRHRRDDPLPIGSTVEVLRADGTVALVNIRGRLALAKKSKAKTHTYIFKKTFQGEQYVRDGSYPFMLNIRFLNGTWVGFSGRSAGPDLEGD